MIGCLRTRVRKQPIIALYFESETVLKFYNLESRVFTLHIVLLVLTCHGSIMFHARITFGHTGLYGPDKVRPDFFY